MADVVLPTSHLLQVNGTAEGNITVKENGVHVDVSKEEYSSLQFDDVLNASSANSFGTYQKLIIFGILLPCMMAYAFSNTFWASL